MTPRRSASAIAWAGVLAVIVWALFRPLTAVCGETEVIRGTVDKFRPGILSLTDVRLPDGNAAKPAMIIVNKDTEYFDGPLRTTKEAIASGVKVIVKCEPAGTGRVAVLVRIIGGKTP